MSWGGLIALLLRALPELLCLWRRQAQRQDKEAVHEVVQEFREALARPAAADGGRAALLLERRLREARQLRAQRQNADKT